ncbi:DUF3100 domain-containing protein [Nostoc sp. 3335mG]|nr:DUF3100 domain-containing protein [Nostoc sp. 3335mG]
MTSACQRSTFAPQAGDAMRIFAVTLIITLAADALGPKTIHLGTGDLTFLPLLWALLAGAVFSLASPRLPSSIAISKQGQRTAAKLLQPGLLLFITTLGLLVGSSLQTVFKAGWALLFQEFGHFLGTMVFGLPIALLLGIKREAIGATFSVGREPSLAIIGERFGMNSPEGRGVLAEYLTGTIFGAVFIALFAGWLTSTGWFSPYALAMGSGIGSGTMMAAASGAIAAHVPPAIAANVATYAAASNLITTTVGTYFTLLVSLPVTIKAYSLLEPILGRGRESKGSMVSDEDVEHDDGKPLSTLWTIICWFALAAMAFIGHWLGAGSSVSSSTIVGLLIIMAISAAGLGLSKLSRDRIPAILFCSLLAMLSTSPYFPASSNVKSITGSIDFLWLVPPILAFAGLSIGKDMPAFRRLGWRIVLVSLCANAGTFLGASLIAQFFTHAS